MGPQTLDLSGPPITTVLKIKTENATVRVGSDQLESNKTVIDYSVRYPIAAAVDEERAIKDRGISGYKHPRSALPNQFLVLRR